jgi:hypothetical protein
MDFKVHQQIENKKTISLKEESKVVSPPGLEPGIWSLVRAPGQRVSCKRYKLEISVTVIVVRIHFQNLYIPPVLVFQKARGAFHWLIV